MEIDGTVDKFKYSPQSDDGPFRHANMSRCTFDPKKKNPYWVVHRMDIGYRAWGALKSVLINRGLVMKAKKCLYEGVIVPTALYREEAWG